MKRITVIILAVLSLMPLGAATRSVEAARQLAEEQMVVSAMRRSQGSGQLVLSLQSPSAMRLVSTGLRQDGVTPMYYVFEAAERSQGFVIVSGDDRALDVLGYADEGHFDADNMPDGMRFWLAYVSERLERIDDVADAVPTLVQRVQAADTYPVVLPLLGNTEWDQDSPYNDLCPMDGDNTRCYTGCVATAAAQVMRYWQFPEHGYGSHSYTWRNCRRKVKSESVDFSAATYDWEHMKDTYYGVSSSQQEKDAVALLMYHCGVACDMSYGGDEAGGSGAYTHDMMNGLITYFGYNSTAHILDQWSDRTLTSSELASQIRSDIITGHPVIVGGTDENAEYGHEFVFDGLDAKGRFHVNWGWSGSCNGYYAITALTPKELGIGAGEAGDYSYNLDAILGLEPDPALLPIVPVQPQTDFAKCEIEMLDSHSLLTFSTADLQLNEYDSVVAGAMIRLALDADVSSSVLGSYYYKDMNGVIIPELSSISYNHQEFALDSFSLAMMTITLDEVGDYVFAYTLIFRDNFIYSDTLQLANADVHTYYVDAQGTRRPAVLENKSLTVIDFAEACERISWLPTNNVTLAPMLVRGVISKMVSTEKQMVDNGFAIFYIRDTEPQAAEQEEAQTLYCFRIKWLGNQPLTTGQELTVGDTVLIYAPWYHYTNKFQGSVYELYQGYVFEHQQGEAPVIEEGLDDVESDETVRVYDILGREVAEPQRGGVYIRRDGKKVVVVSD